MNDTTSITTPHEQVPQPIAPVVTDQGVKEGDTPVVASVERSLAVPPAVVVVEIQQGAAGDGNARSGDEKNATTGGDDTATGGDKSVDADKTATVITPRKPAGGNRLGLTIADYKGGQSTLCNGCGHDAISSHIIKAAFELGLEQHRVAKLSGIGCSSKSPAYFLGRAFGFNTVHGRMPSVATGAALANRNLILLAVSGDGDTASIGIGQFCHVIRRNLPLVYIVENNGVYGLTKGQFSATAESGARQKSGAINELPAVDLCGLALELGATFVARSFSGDPKQMLPLIKAALAHGGTAVIDVLSPCVTFNEHEGSTKSRQWGRENEVPIHALGFVPFFEQISVDYEPGTVKEITLHDGSSVTLKKLERDYDPTDRMAARKLIDESASQKQFLTGLIYVDPTKKGFTDLLNLPAEALATLSDSDVRPPNAVLSEIMESLR